MDDGSQSPVKIAVIMTVFNRRSVTDLCLALLEQQKGSGCTFVIRAYMVDDGCTDGTAEHVISKYSKFVKVITTGGGFYWARGMALAQTHAVAEMTDLDYILWLNDDVQLSPDAILSVLANARSSPGSIVVGATEFAGEVTYTGNRQITGRPTALIPLEPNGSLQLIDGFNGNFVLVPRSAFEALGPIDAGFEHSYGDNDYGLRARQMRIQVLLAPKTIGICARNTVDNTWRDTSLSRVVRTRQLLSRKGIPFHSHLRYNRRHGGSVKGVVYTLGGYSKMLWTIWAGHN